MNAKKLPFEPTDQIKRYLGEILNFNDNFFGQNTKDIFLIDRYIPEVDPVSYRSETNINAFWEYLEEIGGIEYLTDGKQVVLVNFPNIDGDESFAFPKNEKIRILSVEKIKKLQERISDPAPAAVDVEKIIKIKNIKLDVRNQILNINNGLNMISFSSRKGKSGLEKEVKQFKVLAHLWDFRHETRNGKVIQEGSFESLDDIKTTSDSISEGATRKAISRLGKLFREKGLPIKINPAKGKFRLEVELS